MPKISIIVPAYNEEALLEETIKCLKAQTFKNFECIVIDDCSTDQTKVVATKSFGGDSRFRLISNKINSKLPATRNIGLLYASGDYILFLDGDDVISATCLEERYNVAINNDCLENIDISINFADNFTAPLPENYVIGNLIVNINESNCFSVDILNKNLVERKSVFYYINGFFQLYFSYFDL